MKTCHSFFIFYVTFAAVSTGFTQSDQGGFIVPADSSVEFFPTEGAILLPQDGFNLYEAPNGAFKGKILPGPPLGFANIDPTLDTLLTSTLTGTSIRPRLVLPDQYFETSEDLFHLSFDQLRENYVRVWNNLYPSWISIDEIRSKGFKLISWIEFYGAKGRMIHPMEKIAPIRINPQPDAKITETADELYSEISNTGKCQGSFCYVKVTQYQNPYDPEKSREENILKKYKGWIQIIDEHGQPLVAHNSHSE